MKIDNRMVSSDQVKTETGKAKPAEKETVEKFESLITQKEKGEKQEPEQGEKKQSGMTGAKISEQTPADSILRSMGGSPPPTSSNKEVSQEVIQSEVVKTIVDKLMVSNDGIGDKAEVRFTLRPDLKSEAFSGTQIIISKEGGAVKVEFLTDSQNSLNQLNKHTEGLKTQLQENLKSDVVIKTTMSNSDSGHDGRSRQQRNLYEEMED